MSTEMHLSDMSFESVVYSHSEGANLSFGSEETLSEETNLPPMHSKSEGMPPSRGSITPAPSKSKPARNSPSPKKTPKTVDRRPAQLDLSKMTNVTPKRSWQTRSPSFASTSPRFTYPKSESPPSTVYSPNSSSFKTPSSPSSAFRSTTKRFPDKVTSSSPPPTRYQIDISSPTNDRRTGISGTSMKFTSKRFSEKPNATPGPYTAHSSFGSSNVRSTSPFGGTSKRFEDPKPNAPPSTTYDINISSFKINNVPSSAFKSTSPRLSLSGQLQVSTTDFIDPRSSFQTTKPNIVPFATSDERFKAKDNGIPGPGLYYIPELPESLYTPQCK